MAPQYRLANSKPADPCLPSAAMATLLLEGASVPSSASVVAASQVQHASAAEFALEERVIAASKVAAFGVAKWVVAV